MNLSSLPSRPTIPLPSRFNSSFTPSDRQETALKTVAADIYRGVWDEFYQWKAEYNAQALRQLRVEFPDAQRCERGHTSIDEGEDDDWVSDHDYPSSFSSSIDADDAQNLGSDMDFLSFREPTLDHSRFQVTRYGHIPDDLLDASHDESEFELDSYKLSIRPAFPGVGESPGIDSNFHPHPRYFSCTSTSRNITDTDSPNKLNFSPFEDDPAFDLQGLISYIGDLGWQIDFVDPDVEMIQLETVRQLHYRHDLSFAEVDSLRIFSGLRINYQSGLLWNTSQRDLLRWPGMLLSELPELVLSDFGHMPPDEALSSHLKAGFTKFCPNLNCVLPHCRLHAKTEYPALDPIQPLLTSEALRLKKKGAPCNDYCFINLDLIDDSQAEDTYWENAADIKILEGVLQLAPDSLPCDLAIIMHVKCQDVFVYRKRLFPDTVIDENPVFDQSYQSRQLNFVYLRVNTKGPVVVIPDVNASLLNIIVGEIVVVIGDVLFNGRVAGVIGVQIPAPITQQLVTVERLEGNVTLNYVGSVVQGKNGKKSCRNVASQSGEYPLIQVKQGSWGLGAFTLTELKKGQAIGEYTGKILVNGEDRGGPIMNHTGLNYRFDLNKGFLIDSMYTGNEMRYLNHKGPKKHQADTIEIQEKANCDGRVVYVNRDHRIVFQTTTRIPAHAELFIDYGVSYWDTNEEDGGEKRDIYWR